MGIGVFTGGTGFDPLPYDHCDPEVCFELFIEDAPDQT